MNKNDWLQKAKDNRPALLDLISRFHPSMNLRGIGFPVITAPNAEKACEGIRKEVESKYSDDFGFNKRIATTEFSRALDSQDYFLAYQILSETWFGVPETTDCWSYKGFGKTVELLDDPIEEEEFLQ